MPNSSDTPHPDRTANARRFDAPAACIIVFAAIIVFFSTYDQIYGPPAASRYATAQALVENKTFFIDRSRYGATIDRVLIPGGYVSEKPPVLSVIAAEVYAVLHYALGWTFDDNEKSVLYTCNFILMGIPFLLMLCMFWRHVADSLIYKSARYLSLAALAFCSLAGAYSVELSNHTPAAALLFFVFYFAYRIKKSEAGADSRFDYVACGFHAGLLATFDFPSSVFAMIILASIFPCSPSRTLFISIPLGVFPVLLHFCLTYSYTGSLLPLYLNAQTYNASSSALVPGTTWTAHLKETLPLEPCFLYLFHMTLGHHGLFSMTPLSIPAVLACFRDLFADGMWRWGARVTLMTVIAMMAFYTLTTYNYGGLCVGFRWLIPVTPLLFLYFGRFLDIYAGKRWLLPLALILMLFSQLNAIDALLLPWKQGHWAELILSI